MLRKLTKVILADDETAEKIFTYVPERKTSAVTIYNRVTAVGAENVDLGFDDTVTVGTGIPVLQAKSETILYPTSDIYAIVETAADSKIVVVEEYYGEEV